MERRAFSLLQDAESGWWYDARSRVVSDVLLDAALSPRALVLDFGAGNGGMQNALARFGEVHAFEPDAAAREVACGRGYAAVYATMDEVCTHTYDAIVALDVFEHIEDDAAVVRTLLSQLSPNGVLVLTVPAFPFLWSAHDETHHHFRRYTRKTLRALLENNGYAVVSVRYWNVLLFPLVAFLRLARVSGHSGLHPTPLVDRLMRALLSLERALCRVLPAVWGVSIVACARRA